jgi:triose/dihydroxyacetone kinase / FAD-AMP lyase (cyclizing)
VHVPGREPALDDFNVGEDIELGMGIHNEEGSKRLKTDLPGLVKEMLAQLLDPRDTDRAFVNITAKDEVVLLINNLGGVSVLELGCITEEVCTQLEGGYALRPVRILAGTFMTSLNGLGFSISILLLADTGLGAGKSMLELLDAPAEATGWSASVQPNTWSEKREDRLRPSEEGVRELKSSNITC